MEYLLNKKLSLHDSDAKGLTPLHLAVIGLHFAVIDFLLRKDAPVDALCKEGRSPLHYACMLDNSDIVRLLLSAGAKLETQVPGDGRQPVHIAAANGCVEILEVLHGKGASIAQRDSAGNRPLCIACHQGHTKVVEKLLEYGEPLRKFFETRPSEDSPLCIASRAGHFDVARLLIQKGASVKQRDEFGYIPLRYAAYYGHPEVLQLLLEEGAELIDDGEDSNGWGFLLTPNMIGFSEDTNISEDRRRRVHELLEEAERNIDRWNRDDNPDLAFSPQSDAERSGVRQILGYQGNAILRQELHGSGGRKDNPELAASYRTSELPGQYQYPTPRHLNLPTNNRPGLASQRQFHPSLARPHVDTNWRTPEALLQPPSYSSAVSSWSRSPPHEETQRSPDLEDDATRGRTQYSYNGPTISEMP